MNENNIIKQMIEQGKVNEDSKHWLNYVNDVWNIHTNTLNNEKESYKNIEQERFDKQNTIFKAKDFGLFLQNNPLLRIGNCLRQLYFDCMNSYQDPRDYNVIFEMERNFLIKKQWLEKLNFCGLLKPSKNEIINFVGLSIQTTEDAFIYDYEKEKEYALLIKPVNESTQTVKKKIFNKHEPIFYHVAEIILNMILLKKPVKVLYVGKNKAVAGDELNFGIIQNILYCNNNPLKNIDVRWILEDLKQIKEMLEKEIVPKKSYSFEKNLTIEEINDLLSAELIQDFETKKLLNGGTYTSYQCKDCKYRSICSMNATDEGTTNNY